MIIWNLGFASFAQLGMSPQRSASMRRPSPSSTTATHLLRRRDVEALEAAVRLRLSDLEEVRQPGVELVGLLARVAVAAAHGRKT